MLTKNGRMWNTWDDGRNVSSSNSISVEFYPNELSGDEFSLKQEIVSLDYPMMFVITDVWSRLLPLDCSG